MIEAKDEILKCKFDRIIKHVWNVKWDLMFLWSFKNPRVISSVTWPADIRQEECNVHTQLPEVYLYINLTIQAVLHATLQLHRLHRFCVECPLVEY